jgi:anti-sigma B factor antagonist
VIIQTSEIKPGIVVLQMSGRVQMGSDCKRIEKEVEDHLMRNQQFMIFDLTAVDHIDSAVVGQIVKSHSTLSKSGGGLRLAGARGMVESVLKMTQVDRVIPVYPTALAASQDFTRAV